MSSVQLINENDPRRSIHVEILKKRGQSFSFTSELLQNRLPPEVVRAFGGDEDHVRDATEAVALSAAIYATGKLGIRDWTSVCLIRISGFWQPGDTLALADAIMLAVMKGEPAISSASEIQKGWILVDAKT